MTSRNITIALTASALAAAALAWCLLPASVRRAAAREPAAPVARAVGFASGPVPTNIVFQLQRICDIENSEFRHAAQFAVTNETLALIAAKVVSRGGSDAWSQRIRIGKGSRQGIAPNAPVLDPEGRLVGHVIETTATTADVLLLSDPNSHVACEVPAVSGKPIYGVLSGTGRATPANLAADGVSPPLRLDYLDRHALPAANGGAVTSGLGGLYPRGLPVGDVYDVDIATSNYYHCARVTPGARLEALRIVFVLAGWKGAAP